MSSMGHTVEMRLYVGVLALAAALSIGSVAVSLPLLGDGVLFYMCMLVHSGFCDFDWARAFVAYISQLPLAASLGNGLADRSIAQVLFSAGYIVPPMVAWLAALWLHRGRMLGWLGLVVWSITYLTSSLFSVGEYNLTYALAALAASVTLHPMRHRLGGAVLLAIAAVVSIRSYESMALLGPALTFLIAVVTYRDYREQRTTLVQWGAVAIAVLSYASAAVIAAASIIDPRDPSNRGSALESLMIPLPQVVATAVLLGMFVWCLRAQRALRQRIMVNIMSIIGVNFLVLPVLWSRPMDQYYNRIVVGVALAAVVAIAGVSIWRFGMQICTLRMQTWHIRAVLVIVASLIIPYGVQLFTVSEFFTLYHTTLAQRSGVIAIETTPLRDDRFDRFRWRWNNPTTSLVLRADTSQAIVINEPNDEWQPFDPLDTAEVARRIRMLPAWYYRKNDGAH